MARFRGTVQGTTSRLGERALVVLAQSYQGDVRVSFYSKDEDKVDYVRIVVFPHGDDTNNVVLYNGPIADILDKNAHSVIVQNTIKAFAPELLVA